MNEALLKAERLLLMGLLDQAESLYRGAVEDDPRDAVAMMGLARVAVERGDMAGAHAHALRAVRIDPGNAAASAMEARTAELAGLGADAADRRAAVDDRPVRAGRRSLLRRITGR